MYQILFIIIFSLSILLTNKLETFFRATVCISNYSITCPQKLKYCDVMKYRFPLTLQLSWFIISLFWQLSVCPSWHHMSLLCASDEAVCLTPPPFRLGDPALCGSCS